MLQHARCCSKGEWRGQARGLRTSATACWHLEDLKLLRIENSPCGGASLAGAESRLDNVCRYGPCERDDLEQRMKRAVAALGQEEVADIVKKEGKIEVRRLHVARDSYTYSTSHSWACHSLRLNARCIQGFDLSTYVRCAGHMRVSAPAP